MNRLFTTTCSLARRVHSSITSALFLVSLSVFQLIVADIFSFALQSCLMFVIHLNPCATERKLYKGFVYHFKTFTNLFYFHYIRRTMRNYFGLFLLQAAAGGERYLEVGKLLDFYLAFYLRHFHLPFVVCLLDIFRIVHYSIVVLLF